MDAVLGCVGGEKKKKVPVRRFRRAAPRGLKRRSDLNFQWRLSAFEKPISGESRVRRVPANHPNARSDDTLHRGPGGYARSHRAGGRRRSISTARRGPRRGGRLITEKAWQFITLNLTQLHFELPPNSKQLRVQSDRAPNDRLCVA